MTKYLGTAGTRAQHGENYFRRLKKIQIHVNFIFFFNFIPEPHLIGDLRLKTDQFTKGKTKSLQLR